jgi:hypothetical protein
LRTTRESRHKQGDDPEQHPNWGQTPFREL